MRKFIINGLIFGLVAFVHLPVLGEDISQDGAINEVVAVEHSTIQNPGEHTESAPESADPNTLLIFDEDAATTSVATGTWSLIGWESCYDVFGTACTSSNPSPQCNNPAGQSCSPIGSLCYYVTGSSFREYYCS